jgi:hypothetical protein
VLLAAFGVIQRRSAAPLLPPAALTHGYAAGLAAGVALYLAALVTAVVTLATGPDAEAG